MGFEPPSRVECLRALGLGGGLPLHLRRALDFDGTVEPLPSPGPHDWLALHEERGQTFEEFQALCPDPDTAALPIVIQPIDDLPVHAGTCLEHLVAFTGAFFLRDVVVWPALPLPRGHIRSRVDRATGQVQYFAGDILLELAARRPASALCMLGLTAHDIYPDVFVQFAHGVASSLQRVAVCSMARSRPPFREACTGKPAGAIFRRCIRVLSHEVCHMLGMAHCVYAHCLMNGSVDVAEGDKRPLHLCPVDLHKLQWALGFDVAERYRRLLVFWGAMADDAEVTWVSRRLRHVLDGWNEADETRQAPDTPEG